MVAGRQTGRVRPKRDAADVVEGEAAEEIVEVEDAAIGGGGAVGGEEAGGDLGADDAGDKGAEGSGS